MEKPKFTPGPWAYSPRKFDDWGVVRGPVVDDWGPVLICQAKDPSKLDEATLSAHRADGKDPWEANARLIAAAPDLYAAGQAIIDQCDAMLLPDDDKTAALRAALAKVRGET